MNCWRGSAIRDLDSPLGSGMLYTASASGGPRYLHTSPIDEILVTLPEHYAHGSAHAEGRLKMFYDER